MNYELKDKITITKEFIDELEKKYWQEIDYLQTQIANLDDNFANNKFRSLCTNLLTSYYVFVGGIETLADGPIDKKEDPKKEETAPEDISNADLVQEPVEIESNISDFDFSDNTVDTVTYESTPFEYFVDFDDPIGDPITDQDLYNN